MSGVFVVVLVTHLFWPTISTQSPLPHPSTVFLAPSTPLSLSLWMGHWWCVVGGGKSVAMKPITGHLAHTHTRQEDHTMVVVECGDHGWWLLCGCVGVGGEPHALAVLVWWCWLW